jgi:hypothetical protein
MVQVLMMHLLLLMMVQLVGDNLTEGGEHHLGTRGRDCA